MVKIKGWKKINNSLKDQEWVNKKNKVVVFKGGQNFWWFHHLEQRTPPNEHTFYIKKLLGPFRRKKDALDYAKDYMRNY